MSRVELLSGQIVNFDNAVTNLPMYKVTLDRNTS